MADARERGREVMQGHILAELERRQRCGDSQRFQGLLQRYGIDCQQLRDAAAQEIHPPKGYEAFLDEELGILFNLSVAGTADPDPLQLRADEQGAQIISCDIQSMNLIRQREQVRTTSSTC